MNNVKNFNDYILSIFFKLFTPVVASDYEMVPNPFNFFFNFDNPDNDFVM